MSFDYPQQPRRRKGGISGIFMLLAIGAVIFFFMQSSGGPPAGVDSGGGSGANRSVERDSRIDRELREADEYRRQRADVLGTPKSQGSKKTMPSGAGNNSDWRMEDVDTKNANAAPIGSAAKKTVGKDGWSIEDVPTKKKSGTGFELNNSAGGGEVKPAEKSDWSFEDVEPKTKKTSEGDWSVEEVGGKGK